jgi:hypothetical protein
LTLSCEEIVLALRSNCPPSMTPSHLSGREASAEATLAGWIPLQPQKESIRGKVAHCVRLARNHLVMDRELTFSLSHPTEESNVQVQCQAQNKYLSAGYCVIVLVFPIQQSSSWWLEMIVTISLFQVQPGDSFRCLQNPTTRISFVTEEEIVSQEIEM